VSGPSTDELIQELSRDLPPVRPIPPLRWMVAGVLLLWAAIALAGVMLRGVAVDLLPLSGPRVSAAAVFAGLALTGLGGVLAAFGLAVPGRERLGRAGLVTALVGLAVAAGLGTILAWQSVAPPPAPAASDLGCLGIGLALGFLPAVAAVLLAGRAAPHRPLVVVLAAAAGTAALGAVAAQASCPSLDLRHLILGHVLAPAAAAALLTLPLLVALRRARREPE